MFRRKDVRYGALAVPIALGLVAGRVAPPTSAATSPAETPVSPPVVVPAAVALPPPVVVPPPVALPPPVVVPPPRLTAKLAPRELAYGGRAAVSGGLLATGQPVGGQTLELQVAPWPYRQWSNAQHTVTAGDGSYSFVRLRPDRNTRYRVQAIHIVEAASPVVNVWVDPLARVTSRSLGPGRVRLTLVIHHSRDFSSRGSTVWWFVAPRGGRHFVLAAQTRALKPSVGVTFASAIVNPPARRFVFRVCLSPYWQWGVGVPRSQRRCPTHDFTVGRSAR